MKTRNDCREWRELLGAYALGHLEGDERAGLEAHLDGCAQCRDELGALQPVALMLPHADPARFGPAPQPPPELGQRIAATIAGEARAGASSAGGGACSAASRSAARRRPRWRRCCSLFVFGGGGERQPEQQVRVRRSARRASRSTRRWSRTPTGPRSTCTCTGSRSGTLCRVWLRGAERRVLSGRDLPLPLGGRLRRRPQLGARPLAHAGDRRPTPATAPSSRRSTQPVAALQHPKRGGTDVKQDHLRVALLVVVAGAGRSPAAAAAATRAPAAPTAARAAVALAKPAAARRLTNRSERRLGKPKPAQAGGDGIVSRREGRRPGDDPRRLRRHHPLRLPQGQGIDLLLLRRLRRSLAPAPDRRRPPGGRAPPSASMLGTTKRKDGTIQVTYDG